MEEYKMWIGGKWVDAVSEAFSQGRTIKEVQENLEAAQLILESQRELRNKGVAAKFGQVSNCRLRFR